MSQIGPNFSSFSDLARSLGGPAMANQAAPEAPNASGTLSPQASSIDPLLYQLLGGTLSGTAPAQALSPADWSLVMKGLMKGLLKFPNDFQAFLTLMASFETREQALSLAALLSQHPRITVSLEDLKAILAGQSKEANAKLMQLIQGQAGQQTLDGQRLQEVLKELTHLSAQVQGPPMEALKATLLLYLPWHPLAAEQHFQLQQGPPKEEESASSEQDPAEKTHPSSGTLVLYVQTRHLGNFRGVIAMEGIQLVLSVLGQSCPQGTLSKLEQAFQQALQKNGLPPAIWSTAPVQALKQPEAQPADLEKISAQDEPEQTSKSEQKVSIQAPKGLPVAVMMAAYLLSRLIIEADQG